MRIAEPSYLLLLWLIPALAGFYLWSFKRREQLLSLFARSEMLARLLPPVSRSRQRIKAAMLCSALVFALLALLRPQWGFHWEEITREGVDILVAVDVSQSMMAQDVKPNRLERARRELQDLLGKLQGDRVGLIAFAGTAFVQCPLTLDYGAFQMFLDYLSPELIPVQGTSIGDAIRLAQQSFVEQSSTSKALILITDGEDHEGDPVGAAKEAKEAGIRIYTIGIGAEEGAPIPSPSGDGFIKDESGELVMTRLDEETLQRVAVETGGAYVRSTTGDLDLDKIYHEGIKQSLQAAELQSSRQKRWEERFQWPLALTVLFILLEPFVSERGRRRAAGAALLLLALAATPSTARAGVLGDTTIREGLKAYQSQDYETALQKFTDAQIEHPNDPLLDYNLGNTYYKARRFQEAETSYQKVVARSVDPKLREQAYYNLGNTAYRQGKLDEAVKYYEEALKIDPNDLDAKRNLEKARAEILRRVQENQQQQQQRQQQQQPQQQQEQGQDGQGGQGQPPQPQQGEQQNQARGEGQDPQSQAQPQSGAPQEKSGQKQSQPQADTQGQPGQEQKEQPEQRAGKAGPPEPQEQRGQDRAQQGPQGEQQGQSVQQRGQGTQGEAREQAASQGAKGEQQGQAVQGRLSKEEAQRLLNQVRDEQKAGMRMQGQPRRGRASQSPGGKPW